MNTITLNIRATPYPIHIGKDVFDGLPTILSKDKRVLIITDNNMPDIHLKRLMAVIGKTTVIRVDSGEQAKSLDTYQSVITQMVELGFTRHTVMLAFGGGVIGDLVGFIASTYHRGIDYIQIPTTLLAMVDASIGGKTALNIQGYKNIIGRFHHPRAVFINTTLLDTLPKRHFSNGMAEVIKTALIGDASLIEMLTDAHYAIEDVIMRAIMVKKRFVERDPDDYGERHHLNFGHTIGHALETLKSPRYLHGECIAYGMRQMAKGFAYENRLIDLLDKFHLNIPFDYDKEALYKVIEKDKKRQGNTLKIILVKKPGNSFIKQIKLNEIKDYL